MDLEKAIKERRSIRKYQDREIPLELVFKAIELASWAPNSGGFQPWKFYVVKNRDLIDQIGDVVQSKVDLIAAWPEAEQFRDTMNRHQAKCAFFRKAPVIIAVAMGTHSGPADKVLRLRGEADPDAGEMLGNRALINARAQTCAAAVTLLSLGLHSLGLGSCWLAGPMLARREIEKMLGVPEDEAVFALVSVGYPAETPEPAPRKPLDEIVHVL